MERRPYTDSERKVPLSVISATEIGLKSSEANEEKAIRKNNGKVLFKKKYIVSVFDLRVKLEKITINNNS